MKADSFAMLDEPIFVLLLIIRCTAFSVSLFKMDAMKLTKKMNIDNLKAWDNACADQVMTPREETTV